MAVRETTAEVETLDEAQPPDPSLLEGFGRTLYEFGSVSGSGPLICCQGTGISPLVVSIWHGLLVRGSAIFCRYPAYIKSKALRRSLDCRPAH